MSLELLSYLVLFLFIFAILPFFIYLFFITLLALILKSPLARSKVKEAKKRFIFTVPAHNEESCIRETVKSLKEVEYPRELYQILVIADNCTDNTKKSAEEEGATVLERFHETEKSKGYALDYCFRKIMEDPSDNTDAFVVIDADTKVDKNILNVFASYLESGVDFIQAYYTASNPDASWRTRLLTYALSLINGVLLMGQERFGLSVSLRGNGMCFSKKGLSRFPWKAYGLTEDMEFGWWLRLGGERVYFTSETYVAGEMVEKGGDAAASQRQRWEVGRRQLRNQFKQKVFEHAKITRFEKFIYLADLYLPSIGRLTGFLAFAILFNMILCLFTPGSLTLGLAFRIELFMVFTLALYIISPIFLLKVKISYLSSFVYAPFYLGWKLLLSFKEKPTGWIRTPHGKKKNSA
ncbi:MAG: glycosyltransferase family 2 protein [Oligoflexales bacterium]|nr:glycosyltransferase family 2 protein [Oligoflexales bacterium]